MQNLFWFGPKLKLAKQPATKYIAAYVCISWPVPREQVPEDVTKPWPTGGAAVSVQSILEMLITTEECTTVDQVLAGMRKLLALYGFDYFAILRDARAREDGTYAFIAAEWPAGWPETYYAARYQFSDPALRYLAAAQQPFRWKQALKAFRSDPHARQMERMMADAASFGLKDGYIFPIHGRGGLMSFVTVGGAPVDLSPTEMALFQTAFKAAYWRIRILQDAVQPTPAMDGTPEITRRELEVLMHLADGMTSNEISSVLGISRHTVDWYMAGIQEKLGARNRQHAVAIAFRSGMIS